MAMAVLGHVTLYAVSCSSSHFYISRRAESHSVLTEIVSVRKQPDSHGKHCDHGRSIRRPRCSSFCSFDTNESRRFEELSSSFPDGS